MELSFHLTLVGLSFTFDLVLLELPFEFSMGVRHQDIFPAPEKSNWGLKEYLLGFDSAQYGSIAMGLIEEPCKNRVVGNGIHFCDTTKRASQRLTPHIKGDIPLYHRSGNKTLDSTTLCKNI